MRPKILFTRGSNPLSRLIMWLTRSEVSHTAIAGLMMEGHEMVIHATVGGVRPMLRTHFEASHEIVAEYEILPDVCVKAALEKLCERYDYVGLFGYIPVMIARKLRLLVRNPLASPGAVVCSELILSLDPEREIFPEWRDYPADATTPEDLLSDCRTHPEHFAEVKKT